MPNENKSRSKNSSNDGPFFIAIEGIDGSGKGTQVDLLKKYVEQTYSDLKVTKTCEPTDSDFGDMIREEMKEKATTYPEILSLLFACDRARHVTTTIAPELKKGNFVISERYVYSSFAYQGQKMNPRWLADINVLAIVPDMVIFLDIDPREAQKRINKRSENAQEKNIVNKKEFFEKEFFFLEKANEKFRDMCDGKLKLPISSHLKKAIQFHETEFVRIDGSGTIDEIHEKIKQNVDRLVRGELRNISKQYDFDMLLKQTSQTSLMEFMGKKKNQKNERAEIDLFSF